MIQTVDENKSYYSQWQVEHARKARDLLHTLGCPSIQDLKKIITMNSIQNCPVTIEDINIAEQIYGKDIASIKGKTVRKKPPPAIQDIVEIPEELITHQRNVELCIDAFFVNEIAFLATISKNITYRTCHPVEMRKQSDYRLFIPTTTY
jgi:hypothetical protein